MTKKETKKNIKISSFLKEKSNNLIKTKYKKTKNDPNILEKNNSSFLIISAPQPSHLISI